MEVRAVDVALLRRDTAISMDSAGPGLYQAAINAGVQLARPDLPDREAAVKLTEDETRRLRLADLFFVSTAMVNLAIVASGTLPDFSIAAEDVPTPLRVRGV